METCGKTINQGFGKAAFTLRTADVPDVGCHQLGEVNRDKRRDLNERLPITKAFEGPRLGDCRYPLLSNQRTSVKKDEEVQDVRGRL